MPNRVRWFCTSTCLNDVALTWLLQKTQRNCIENLMVSHG
jgi:hypothetical protein